MPTTHNMVRPYFTMAAGPTRNSPLPIAAPRMITPGPTAPNQPKPFGSGAGGNSALRHASRPDRASLGTAPGASVSVVAIPVILAVMALERKIQFQFQFQFQISRKTFPLAQIDRR